MKVSLILVGKTSDKHIEALLNDYVSRLSHYLTFEVITISEKSSSRNQSIAEQKEAEGKLILEKVKDNAQMVLLDEHGVEYRSLEFASYMEKQLNTGRELCFVIGGPYGFSDDVYRRSNGKISLSKMTFSHQMVRVIFTEQLYRAMTILKGEKYHHE